MLYFQQQERKINMKFTRPPLVAISLFLIFLFYQGRGHGPLPLDPLLFQRR